MAYCLESGESVSKGMLRIMQEEVAWARKHLGRGGAADRDHGIHEARKSVKKIRSVLRLLRSEIGKARRAENTRLRNVGRQLSEPRDAAVLIEAADALAATAPGATEERAFSVLREHLAARKAEIERTIDLTALRRKSAAALDRFGARAAKWNLTHDGFEPLAAGFEQAFRGGARALAAAERDRKDELFHEWRKRVKDHLYHVRLLSELWPAMMAAYEACLKDVETCLGDDHNLTVLRQAITANAGGLNEDDLHFITGLIAARQAELRHRALETGRRIYVARPKDLTRSMDALWRLGRN
jgi:CHAD domain-containing protein